MGIPSVIAKIDKIPPAKKKKKKSSLVATSLLFVIHPVFWTIITLYERGKNTETPVTPTLPNKPKKKFIQNFFLRQKKKNGCVPLSTQIVLNFEKSRNWDTN